MWRTCGLWLYHTALPRAWWGTAGTAWDSSPCLQSYNVFSHFQVKCSDGGGYIDVPYIADAILVNLGALMQQWTSDIYLATVRLAIRVIILFICL